MIRIRRIETSHPLYAQARELAARVVHERENERSTHALFVAIKDLPAGERVVGCLAVRDAGEPGVGAVEWFAVDPQMQGQDLGRRLIADAETEAFTSLGLERLICDAPKRAKAFLTRMGWREVEGEAARDGVVRMVVAAEPPQNALSGPADPTRE